MITIERSVLGVFIAEDRKQDVEYFNNNFRTEYPGYTGLSYEGDSDIINFHFDSNVITHSSANDALENAMNNYFTSSLYIAKILKKKEINVERDKRLYDHFPYGGFRWDCNSESRANIIGANTLSVLGGGHLPPGMVWRDYDNNNHSVDAMFMGQMGMAMFSYSSSVYTASWIHKANVDALTNATDVGTYDYSSRWPSMEP